MPVITLDDRNGLPALEYEEIQAIQRWEHLTLGDTRYWIPPTECGLKRVENCSPLDAIELIESTLTKRRGRNIQPDSVDEYLESELASMYLSLDGIFDSLPYHLATVPQIINKLLPYDLWCYVLNDDLCSLVAPTGLQGSIIHQFLCDKSSVSLEQLIFTKKQAALVVLDTAGGNEQIYPFQLPKWISRISELISAGWQTNRIVTVRQLIKYLYRYMENST